MKKKYSIRTQLIFILIMFVFGILLITYVCQTTLLDVFYKKSKIKSLEEIASKISGNLYSNDLDDYINELSMSSEVCVRVVSSEPNKNIVKPCTLQSLDGQLINKIAVDTVNNGGTKLFDIFSHQRKDMKRDDVYIFAKMVESKNNYTMVLVSSLITPLGATLTTIKSQYVIIAIVVIIMAIVLALCLSHFIIKPINKINNESKNLPIGKYDGEKIDPISKEFEELNSTLSNANKDILKADEAKRELLGNVSHDLRTPLTMIVGYGEMIRDLPEENNEENINVIIDEAKRLSALVDDLIDISKFESNNVEIHKEEISINELLAGVYHQYEKYCESQSVTFELKVASDAIVNIDVRRIQQVLYNFINNSLNYNEKKNQIIILGCEKYNGKNRVYVYDNGDGIDEKDINNIWDRYYKVDKEHKRQHIGSGIGLALSKQLLIAHNIDYGVESKKGEYCKFYFDL